MCINYTSRTKILYFLKMKCLFSLLLLAQISAAQKSNIYGVVKDKSTEDPVLFAHIYIANTARGTTSGTNGQFILENI